MLTDRRDTVHTVLRKMGKEGEWFDQKDSRTVSIPARLPVRSHVFEFDMSRVIHTEHKHVLILVTAVTHLLQQRRFPFCGSLVLSTTQRDYKIQKSD